MQPTGNPSTKSVQVAKKFASKMKAVFFAYFYVAKFEEAIYVLHCFQKKTQATSKKDKTIAEARYRAVLNLRKTGKAQK